jgi:hypothetical protein
MSQVGSIKDGQNCTYGSGSALFPHGIEVQFFFASSNLPEAYIDGMAFVSETRKALFTKTREGLRKPCETDRSARCTKNGIWTRLLHLLS